MPSPPKSPDGELAVALLASAAEAPAAPALIIPDGPVVTYAALAQAARRCARALETLGLAAGQRVALVLMDNPGFPAWYAGAQLLGAVPCPVPAGMTPHETSAALRAVDPRCAVADAPVALGGESVPPILAATPWQGEAGWRPTLTAPDRPLAPHHPGPADTAAVHVTYRGLGRPLGVCHGPRAQHAASRAVRQRSGLSRGDRVLGVLPFARIFSFSVNLLAPLGAGAALILANSVRPHRLPALVQSTRPTLGFITPAQALALATFQARRPADLSSLRRLWCGGAPLAQEQVQRFNEATGLELLQGYGLTEAFVVCANPWTGGTPRPETLGLPMPGYKVRIVDAQGHPLPDGEEGKLQVAGEAVMSGYLGEPGLTRRALDGPWLRTGDRAIRDPDGHLRFTGWDKAIVKTLGLVVDREEVRAALLDLLPGGARVRLSARPRPRWGHQYAARVTCPGSAPAMDELRARLAVRLSFYKIPDPIEVVPAGLSSL